MILFQSILFWLIFILFTIILSPLLIILRPFSYNFALSIAKIWANIIIISARQICGLHYRLAGASNLKNSNSIIFSKHQSAWETIFFLKLIEKPIFIVKRELTYIPLFGWCLYLLNNISINRKSGKTAMKKMITESEELMRKGFRIIIFPQGTRVGFNCKTEIKKGGLVMVKSLNLSIIPIKHNAGKFWGKSSFLINPGIINIVIGSPMVTDNISSGVLKSQIELWMDDLV